MANPEQVALLRQGSDRWNTWYRRHPGILPDLRGADLINADLRGANLSRANLTNAHLRDADLRDANLVNANLTNADLRGTDLSFADLRGADLRGADLGSADLSFTHLDGALLGPPPPLIWPQPDLGDNECPPGIQIIQPPPPKGVWWRRLAKHWWKGLRP